MEMEDGCKELGVVLVTTKPKRPAMLNMRGYSATTLISVYILILTMGLFGIERLFLEVSVFQGVGGYGWRLSRFSVTDVAILIGTSSCIAPVGSGEVVW